MSYWSLNVYRALSCAGNSIAGPGTFASHNCKGASTICVLEVLVPILCYARREWRVSWQRSLLRNHLLIGMRPHLRALLWWQRLLCSALEGAICSELVERVCRHDHRLPPGNTRTTLMPVQLTAAALPSVHCLPHDESELAAQAGQAKDLLLTCVLPAAAGCSSHSCGLRWTPA